MSAWMPKLRKLMTPPNSRWLHMAAAALPCNDSCIQRIVAAKSNHSRLHGSASGGGTYGEEDIQEHVQETARDAASEGQDAALAALVRQSGKPRHDRALSGALHELRPHPEGTALRQADHRDRADR